MSLVIKPNKNFDYERVEIDIWINGTILDIQERLNKNRKYKDEETNEWKTKEVEEIRFVFELDGCQYKHYSRWMTKSISERSNLFKKYLKKLLPNITPDSPVDLEGLKNLKVKTMWDEEIGKDGSTYQHVANIKSLQDVPDISFEEEVDKEFGPTPF